MRRRPAPVRRCGVALLSAAALAACGGDDGPVGPPEPTTGTLEASAATGNCAVDGDNPRTVAVTGGETASTTFGVSCTRIERIVFESDRTGDRDLWSMEADGSAAANLTEDPGTDVVARWSPDGARIAFRSDRTGDDEIWAMDADGTDPTQLTDDPGDDRVPRWRP